MQGLNQSQYALMGLLSSGAKSGYDLKQLSEWTVGHFWRESYGQIYPSLKRLAVAGLVKKKTETNAGRPDRHVYSLTAAGRKELETWLKKAAVPEVPRIELLLKLFFGGLISKEACSAQVRDKAAQCERELEEYAAVRARIERERTRHPHKPYWLMTLSYGEHMARARMDWCDETLRRLKQIPTAR
jgi:PadR family transcriptional regulator, regulatory protein AphA